MNIYSTSFARIFLIFLIGFSLNLELTCAPLLANQQEDVHQSRISCLDNLKSFGKSVFKFSITSSLVVGAAYGASQVSNFFPKDSIIGQALGPLLLLGLVNATAPLSERLHNASRLLAYRLNSLKLPSFKRTSGRKILDETYIKMQHEFTFNEQHARTTYTKLIETFSITLQNCLILMRSFNDEDTKVQIASAILSNFFHRMNLLYPEIKADDEIVIQTFEFNFLRFIKNDLSQKIQRNIFELLRASDPDFTNSDTQVYYFNLLTNLFTTSQPE